VNALLVDGVDGPYPSTVVSSCYVECGYECTADDPSTCSAISCADGRHLHAFLVNKLPQQQQHPVSSNDTCSRSPQNVESEGSATERESGAEEEAYVSENDLEITPG
jgi:hypothetical protein